MLQYMLLRMQVFLVMINHVPDPPDTVFLQKEAQQFVGLMIYIFQ